MQQFPKQDLASSVRKKSNIESNVYFFPRFVFFSMYTYGFIDCTVLHTDSDSISSSIWIKATYILVEQAVPRDRNGTISDIFVALVAIVEALVSI